MFVNEGYLLIFRQNTRTFVLVEITPINHKGEIQPLLNSMLKGYKFLIE